MVSEAELFAAVDALLEEGASLPPPVECARLREAAGISQSALARVMRATTQTVKNWENGRSVPQGPRLAAYRRLLEGWAAKYPAPAEGGPAAATASRRRPVPGEQEATGPAGSRARQPSDEETGRRSPQRAAAPPASDPRFPHGPLAVLDGDGAAHGSGGIVLECPAASVAELVQWAGAESGLGAPRLHRYGKEADPLIVLTTAAAARLGLPEHLEDHDEYRRHLPEDHPVVESLVKDGWRLTRRGFGPWTRISLTVEGGARQGVRLAILPWNALDERLWPGVAGMDPAGIARTLGVFAERVITPRGSPALAGLDLMTALRPPTRPERDKATGNWVPAPNPGSLGTEPVDPAPPEAGPAHPLVVQSGWSGAFLDEEAFEWVRDSDLLTDEERRLPFAVGVEVNAPLLAAAARLPVGLSEPVHVVDPPFDPRIPGCWLVDLSHVEVGPRLPSPFTPTGHRPEGPAWYQTHSVAYAQELGCNVHPLEAYLRREKGAYLQPWHDRLKSAYLDTLADLGVTPDLPDAEFLEAMGRHRQVDPALATVLAAIEATVEGGIGKLGERPRGRRHREGERWPALERATWRPDIRAAVVSKARISLHRRLLAMARMTGRYPLAVCSGCVVYPSPGPSPVDFLPYSASGKAQPAGFRLGLAPGMVRLKGVRPMPWALGLMEQGHSPACHIEEGDPALHGE
ncbi:helix-turn-helix domain-containing protein [Streptomyces sp. NPDC007189]|uniref:telomere-associated protein Tap n=1 Tax=Streptomyces sp. NPDC007189 TaxID=3154315 RepID=UPI00345505EA